MKRYISSITAMLLTAILSIGCSNLLDQEPQGEWIDGDQKAGSYEADIFTIYGKLRGYNLTAGLPPLAIHGFRSEDAEKGSTASDGAEQARMFDDFEYVATNGMISSYYTANYEVIHLTNTVIDKIKNANQSSLTDGDKINKAEAHFFRAFAYFNLVRAFGEVPLIDFAVKNAEEANKPKAKISDIYKLIDTDLTIAEEFLPKNWASVYIGRLTWGTARALHAKTYLMRNDWQNTYTAASDIINSGIYNLNTAYNQIFREEGENNSGSIFEIQCTANATHPGSNEVGSQFAQVQGVRGAGEWNLGWGWHTPTQLLADAFEAEDPRKNETLLYFTKTGENQNDIPANSPYNEKPIANAAVVNKYYNKKAYTNPSLRAQYTKSGFWYNIRLIRYADVVLMAAESANELGNSGQAVIYLEQIRARARAGNNSILPEITTTNQVELRNAIRHERRVELGMEFDRFYDLVRWGVAQEVLHAAGKTNYQPKHEYLPLPQKEVDRSNGVLIQNPNY
ncbi:RagB/SusD family nutrient uptake outer membrane protein [Capnocytophaga cynodegmi]|uniref:SusD family protein n=1 Tax=Capnocytophaga cynodegmi TaxID=28189 RepID=A0A0B7H3C8_9FLAO|nr:RagB/SusD family nutrient uptake outer membrane protein [Capnocytophaga cynodegmi]CEN33034.1 SusD family protein [Capnocytophaga cynodegmi]